MAGELKPGVHIGVSDGRPEGMGGSIPYWAFQLEAIGNRPDLRGDRSVRCAALGKNYLFIHETCSTLGIPAVEGWAELSALETCNRRST